LNTTKVNISSAELKTIALELETGEITVERALEKMDGFDTSSLVSGIYRSLRSLFEEYHDSEKMDLRQGLIELIRNYLNKEANAKTKVSEIKQSIEALEQEAVNKIQEDDPWKAYELVCQALKILKGECCFF
jgi:hypothetical protein